MTGDEASAILLAAIEGEILSTDEKSFFERECPAGVTLFKRNISPSFNELRKNLNHLQEIVSQTAPAIIAIDQEGGRVSRINAPFPNLGPAETLWDGDHSQESLTHLSNYGYIVGSSLLALGINVNFAPVCDINTNPKNIAIGDRAFGRDPESASTRAGAFLDGMQNSGVLGCLKHFPGQGDAGEDTHLSGTRIEHSEAVLWERECAPFRELLDRTPMVMISHAVFPSLDDKPASLSSAIINDFLRDKLGFTGVVVSDDMNMKAMPQGEQDWQDALCAAVLAGSDLLLVCQGLDRCKLALEGLRREAKRSPAFQSRLSEAALRVEKLRARLASNRA